MTPDLRARLRWATAVHECGHLLAGLVYAKPRTLAVAVLFNGGDGVSELPPLRGWRNTCATLAGGLAAAYLAHLRPPPGPVPDLPDDGWSAAALALRSKWHRGRAASATGKLESDTVLANAAGLCSARRQRHVERTLAMLWRHQTPLFQLADVLYTCGEVCARTVNRRNGKRRLEILTTT